MSCYFCNQIAAIENGQADNLIAELPETYVFLKSSKLFPGYCLVVSKEHLEQLPELPTEKQLQIFRDVSVVGNAIYAEQNPQRLNYECLGNLVAHIHWHIIPRYKSDLLPEGPVWKIDKSMRDEGNEASELAQLKKRLSKKIDSLKIV